MKCITAKKYNTEKQKCSSKEMTANKQLSDHPNSDSKISDSEKLCSKDVGNKCSKLADPIYHFHAFVAGMFVGAFVMCLALMMKHRAF